MKAPKVSDRLRAALEASPDSLQGIARETGVAASIMSRFMRGETGIGIGNLDALAEYLELDLLPKAKPAKTRKAR